MPKILIYSHGADIDGVGCVVLAKYAFPNVDYELCSNVNDLERKFRKDMQSNRFDEYAAIYVTDLALYEPSLTMAFNDESIRKKLTIIDHHQRSIDDGCDKYDFVHVYVKIDGRKTCATELFYHYLYMKNFIRYTDSSFDFVEHVRQEDTWEWKNGTAFGRDSHYLSLLFNAKGVEYFINSMVEKLTKNNKFELSEKDKGIVEDYNKKIMNEILELINDIAFFVDEDGNKFAAVFAPYHLRNEFAEYMREGNMDISYFVIVSLDNTEYGQKSYRIVKDGCDLNKIAMKHGGGGHKESAHVLITKEQGKKLDTFTSKKDVLWYIVNESYSELSDFD